MWGILRTYVNAGSDPEGSSGINIPSPLESRLKLNTRGRTAYQVLFQRHQTPWYCYEPYRYPPATHTSIQHTCFKQGICSSKESEGDAVLGIVGEGAVLGGGCSYNDLQIHLDVTARLGSQPRLNSTLCSGSVDETRRQCKRHNGEEGGKHATVALLPDARRRCSYRR